MINPITAKEAFDAKADDVPEIKIGIRGVYRKGGPSFHDCYFDITVGGETFSVDNGKEYDSYEKRCYFNIYESRLRNGLSGIFGENPSIVQKMYNLTLNAIRDFITNDPAYRKKYGPNAGVVQITSIQQEQRYLQRIQRGGGFIDEETPDVARGLSHDKIQ